MYVLVMASVSMTVSVEAYDALAKLKRDKESFSEVILRVVAPQKSIWDMFGILTDEEADELEKGVARFRKEFKVREWPS